MTGKTDKPYTLDGITYYRETPTNRVIHDGAKFFAFIQIVNDNVFSQHFVKEGVRPVSGRRPGWGRESTYREVQPMDVGNARWEMKFYTFPPEAIEPHLSDLTIEEKRAHWLPDFYGNYLGLIVTERAKAVIEELDLGMNYFFPMSIKIRETGQGLGEPRFYWRPRREIDFSLLRSGEEHGPLLSTPYVAGSPFSDAEIAWELANNERLRDFLADIPFWNLSHGLVEFGMSPGVFKRLKQELFTGLIEIEGTDPLDEDFDHNQNIGCF